MVAVVVASVVLILFGFALFSIRLLLIKNAEFRGTCASNSPFLKKDGITCGVCGRKSDEACGRDETKTQGNPA